MLKGYSNSIGEKADDTDGIRVDYVGELKRLGFDFNVQDDDGMTALMFACYQRASPDVIESLIEATQAKRPEAEEFNFEKLSLGI